MNLNLISFISIYLLYLFPVPQRPLARRTPGLFVLFPKLGLCSPATGRQ